MTTDDWDSQSDDWQPATRKPSTFATDLKGLAFHLIAITLIGFTTAYAWQVINPQLTIQFTTEQIN